MRRRSVSAKMNCIASRALSARKALSSLSLSRIFCLALLLVVLLLFSEYLSFLFGLVIVGGQQGPKASSKKKKKNTTRGSRLIPKSGGCQNN